MSTKTNIEWASSTGSPWIGCTKVSPGCARCYAATMDEQRFSKTMGGTKDKPVSHWGKGAPRVRTKTFWTDAVKWNREAKEPISVCSVCHAPSGDCIHGPDFTTGAIPPRPRIFPSLCDWLDDEVPIEWLADFLSLVRTTPNLDWLLLSKRPQLFAKRISEASLHAAMKNDDDTSIWCDRWKSGALAPSNVWLGVSVEDQKRADERIPFLLEIPAKVRFLSVEPLLEPVQLGFCDVFEHTDDCTNDNCALAGGPEDCDGILVTREKPDWVIVGGESGKNRRDCGVEAICDVARQCVAAGVPCFVKQASAFKPGQRGDLPEDIWALKQFPQ